MTRFAPLAVLLGSNLSALTGLTGPAAADAGLAAACPDVTAIHMILGQQPITVPRKDVKAVQAPTQETSDPRRGCPDLPVTVGRIEIGGQGPSILITPGQPAGSIADAVAYLRQMRGSDRCTGPDRLDCHVSENHGGNKIPFRYIFATDPRQTMSDGAPAHARCLEGPQGVCLVDMNDPRGFHATMAYPTKTFGPSQVGAFAEGVRERLKGITGKTASPNAMRRILTVPAAGTVTPPGNWLDRRSCEPERVTLDFAGRKRTLPRAELLMITTEIKGSNFVELGCPENPIPARSLLVQDATGPIIVTGGEPTPLPNPSGPCVPESDMTRCPIAPAPGEREASIYRANGALGATMVCRALPTEPYPRCEANANRDGLKAERILAVPRDSAGLTSAEQSLKRVLEALAR